MTSLLLLLATAQAEPTTADLWQVRSPTITYTWAPELLGTIGLLGGYLALRSIGPRETGSEADPSGLDAWGHPRWSEATLPVSDVFGDPRTYGILNVPWAAAIGIGVYGGLADDSAAAGAGHGLIVIESVAVSIVITEILKVSIARPRPYTSAAFQAAYPEAYAGEYIQEALGEEGHLSAWKSMPSGHTSTAGAATFSAATLLLLHDDRTGVKIAALSGAGALTATAGWLRVRAGVHHPTDTIAGGLLGAGVGVGTAWLHRSSALRAAAALRIDRVGLTESGVTVAGRW